MDMMEEDDMLENVYIKLWGKVGAFELNRGREIKRNGMRYKLKTDANDGREFYEFPSHVCVGDIIEDVSDPGESVCIVCDEDAYRYLKCFDREYKGRQVNITKDPFESVSFRISAYMTELQELRHQGATHTLDGCVILPSWP